MEVRLRPRRKAREEPETAEPVILPNTCPECGGPGYLDYINLTHETKTQACPSCRVRWESPID